MEVHAGRAISIRHASMIPTRLVNSWTRYELTSMQRKPAVNIRTSFIPVLENDRGGACDWWRRRGSNSVTRVCRRDFIACSSHPIPPRAVNRHGGAERRVGYAMSNTLMLLLTDRILSRPTAAQWCCSMLYVASARCSSTYSNPQNTELTVIVKTDNVLLKTKLTDAACQMGAVHKLDLTSDVTHLLVANINTPKYRYVAKERPDIRVLLPDFVEAVRKAWMEGVDIDVEALEKEHTLPPFFGLQVCITGFPEQPQRSNMERSIISNGANYHGDLTKTVTHLITAKPEGAKYIHAKQWNITVVSMKWYQDSLTRGMALQEDLYAPEMPLEQQGKNAFREKAKRPTSLSKRARDGEQGAGSEGSSRRKLRKTASMRFDSQSQDMWQSISAQEVQVEATVLDAWDDESQTLRASERPQSKGESASLDPVTPMVPVESNGLFSGHYILIHGFEANRIKHVRNMLEPNGATVVESPEELERAAENLGFQVRCLLTPQGTPTVLPNVPPGTWLVTEWWVERCIHYRQRLDPAEDVLSSPLSNELGSGFADMIISSAGLNWTDLLQTARAVKLMGATYEETLLPSASVLVCNPEKLKKEKAGYARKYSIPVVSANWLWDSLRTRKTAPFDKYKIEMPAFDPEDVYAGPSASTPVPSEEKSQLAMRGSVDNAKR